MLELSHNTNTTSVTRWQTLADPDTTPFFTEKIRNSEKNISHCDLENFLTMMKYSTGNIPETGYRSARMGPRQRENSTAGDEALAEC